MISTCGKTSCQDYIIPGWNDYVKETHSEARNCYILWHNMGKPKHNPVFDLMQTRLHSKYLLKQRHQREEMACADVMATSMHSKDVTSFLEKCVQDIRESYTHCHYCQWRY